MATLFRLLSALAFLLLLTPAAWCDTFYVAKDGTRVYPYDTWEKATDTVARAVEAAGEWDTILVGPGHFVTDTIRMKRGQVLMGAGIEVTLLDTLPLAPTTFPILAEDSCSIRDFSMIQHPAELEVREGTAAGSAAVGPGIRLGRDKAATIERIRFDHINTAIHLSFSDWSGLGNVCLVRGCEFLYSQMAIFSDVGNLVVDSCIFRWDRSAFQGMIDAHLSILTVKRCRFYGIDPSSYVSNSAAAIHTTRSDPIVIRKNLIYNNMLAPALALNWDEGDTGRVQFGLIENNTIIRSLPHIRVDDTGFVFRNNISMWDQSGFTTDPFYDGLITGEYNLTWDNSPWDSGVVRGADTIPNDVAGNHDNRNVYPMFVDTLEFLLQAFSPAIDAGDPSILDPDGSRSDIGYTGGPGGFTYVYQDLSPAVPRGVTATPSDSQIALLWRGNHEADFSHYDLYRDTLPIAVPDPTLRIATPGDSTYADTSVTAGETYYYRLTATDNQANVSALSEEVSVIAVGIGEEPVRPLRFELHPNYPNPFNAATRIEYTLDRPAIIWLAVYDILGRRVATLAEGAEPAGRHAVIWEAADWGSGVYFIVLEVGGRREVRKALLLK